MDIHRKKFMSEHIEHCYSNDVPFDPESLPVIVRPRRPSTKEGADMGYITGRDGRTYTEHNRDEERYRLALGNLSDLNTPLKRDGCEDRIPNVRALRERIYRRFKGEI